MLLQNLTLFHEIMLTKTLTFYTELFSKPIWGDMGEDCASVYIQAIQNHWHLHYIRTQSGEPYPLSPTVCNKIDAYEKTLQHEELYAFLSMHQCLQEFEQFVKTSK